MVTSSSFTQGQLPPGANRAAGGSALPHQLLEADGVHFVRRLQQALGDPPNPGLVPTQQFFDQGA